MALQLVTGADNKILRTPSKPVGSVTGELRNFALDMIKAMQAEKGIGIAAPQVGRNIRMCICKLNPGEKNEVIVPMVNPVLLDISDETTNKEEGCLSLPGKWGNVDRAKTVLLRYKNLKGQETTLELEDFNARIIQHEIDHLDGVLFIDRTDKVEDHAKDEDGVHI